MTSFAPSMQQKMETAVEIDPTRIPNHVAIIMDGNGRWAKQRGWHRGMGHMQGSSRVKEIVRESDRLGIKILTLYCFSSENWSRPLDEISGLMLLLKQYLIKEGKELFDNNVKLQALGETHRLPKDILSILQTTIDKTANNTGLILNFCISYGARPEILRGVQNLAADVAAGRLKPEDITEELISQSLYTKGLADPDLIIRTSGEYRLSNFMLWQSAYSELYITDVLWPDFDKQHLQEACLSYSKRERRFGKA